MDKHNGWTNYATWRINLEICDDTINSLVEDIPHGGTRFADASDLAEYLTEDVDNVITGWGDKEDGIAVSYARAFVSDVNFYEIAESALTDHPELIEAEETDLDN